MAHVQGLRCRECAREYDIAPIFTCEWCFGPLEVAYDYDAIAHAISREKIAAGPLTMWRYPDLLPVERNPAVDLGAGFTPLVRADRLAAELGLGELWIKNDTVNPTNSFKDRVTSVALSKALEFGFKTAGVRVDGQPRELGRRARRARGAAQLRLHPRGPRAGQDRHDVGLRRQRRRDRRQLRRRQPPLRGARGHVPVGVRERQRAHVLRRGLARRSAFEIAEQLGLATARPRASSRSPAARCSPRSARASVSCIKVGLLDEEPQVRVSGAQAAGCSPIATAWLEASRQHQAGEAEHDRQVARDRQPGRRLLRARRACARPAGVRRGHRRGDRRRDAAARRGPRASSPRPRAA